MVSILPCFIYDVSQHDGLRTNPAENARQLNFPGNPFWFSASLCDFLLLTSFLGSSSFNINICQRPSRWVFLLWMSHLMKLHQKNQSTRSCCWVSALISNHIPDINLFLDNGIECSWEFSRYAIFCFVLDRIIPSCRYCAQYKHSEIHMASIAYDIASVANKCIICVYTKWWRSTWQIIAMLIQPQCRAWSWGKDSPRLLGWCRASK